MSSGGRVGRLNPAVAALRSAVAGFCERHGIRDDALVLVAVSGGADSLALAAATVFVGSRDGFSVGAVVIDHGVQDASATIAEQTRAQLVALGCDPVIVRRVTVGMTGGLEAAARTARYAELRSVQTELGAVAVLTGHTQDDQAETVLLALARGSGPGSLRGIDEWGNGIGRPLLGVTRAQTRTAIEAQGLEPWDDPHNVDERFSRVRVRRTVLPMLEEELGPGIAEALARTAELARDDDDALDALASGMARQVLRREPDVSVAVSDIEHRPRALRTRILRIAAAEAGLTALSYAHTRTVDDLITQWHGQAAIDVPGGSVVRQDGAIIFRRASEG